MEKIGKESFIGAVKNLQALMSQETEITITPTEWTLKIKRPKGASTTFDYTSVVINELQGL